VTSRERARGCLSDLAAEIWLEEPTRVRALLAEVGARISAVDWREGLGPGPEPGPKPARRYPVDADGVAHLAIRGHILARVPWLLEFFGIEATSTEELAADLASALADDDVRAIALDVDSPGGTVSGVPALAAAISAASKPVLAHASSDAASAAYWLISGAATITAEPGARVGSIGVYSVVEDSSRQAEAVGIRVHVLRSGEHKGVGQEGAPVSESQLAALQHVVDRYAEMFRVAIEQGRGLPADEVRALADGRTWVAEDAIGPGLIDRVETRAEAQAAASAVAREEKTKMETAEILARLDTLDKRLAESEQKREAAEVAAEKARAEAETAKASLIARRDQDRAAIIDRHAKAGRIAPANRVAIERLAASFGDDLHGLDEYLAMLPSIVQPEPRGGGQREDDTAALMSAEEKKIAKIFRLSPAQQRGLGRAVGARADGTIVDADGNALGRTELGL
jgi:signal peptide peptidase SppA